MKKQVLILTSEFDKSVENVINILNDRGVVTHRFNCENLPVNADLIFEYNSNSINGFYEYETNNLIDFNKIDSFWYRHPGKPVPDNRIRGKSKDFIKDETFLASEGFWMSYENKGFWLSKPSKINLSRFRLHQLSSALSVGFKIPKTIITNSKKTVLDFYKCNNKQIIAKPVGVGIPLKNKDGYNYYEVVFTKIIDSHILSSYLDTIKLCPSIFQEYINKDIEIRATVVGNKVFSCAIHSQNHLDKDVHIDWRRVSPDELNHSIYTLRMPIDIYVLKLKLLYESSTKKAQK
jgi:hypothetical protein